ncbi:MAG: hypothetical protein ACMXYD_04400 [Candidatus Woesearchaeota archaeon]
MNKRIQEAEQNTQQYIREGLLKKELKKTPLDRHARTSYKEIYTYSYKLDIIRIHHE